MTRPAALEPESPLAGLRPRAILRGFLWDNALSLVFGIGLASYWVEGGFAGASDAEIDALFASTQFGLVMLVVGSACSVFGGYVAGSRAGVAHVKNGFAVGVADLALALVALPLDTAPPAPLWLDAFGFVLVLPATALGGFLATRRGPSG
jgi:hypothetical protein